MYPYTNVPLLTHSRIIYGNSVETCEPYPRDYMSELTIKFCNYYSISTNNINIFKKNERSIINFRTISINNIITFVFLKSHHLTVWNLLITICLNV